jgi:hypothetical protein
MSLKSIGQGLNQFAFGKDCKDCEAFNVTCHDTGAFDSAPQQIQVKQLFMWELRLFFEL